MASKKDRADVSPEIPKVARRTKDKEQEKRKLRSRLMVLQFECEDFWSGKREEHSHVFPIFREYWRLVQIARDLYPKNLIFDELDITEETQPNADDIQSLELDIRKILAVFQVEDCPEPDEK